MQLRLTMSSLKMLKSFIPISHCTWSVIDCLVLFPTAVRHSALFGLAERTSPNPITAFESGPLQLMSGDFTIPFHDLCQEYESNLRR